MEWFRLRQQTPVPTIGTRSKLSIFRKLFWTWAIKSHNNSTYHYDSKRNGYNKYIYTIKKICLILATSVIATPANAADVGGVSATANPIANSSGSVTNQAIQVLQGPYITNTYGNGIQCQGATMNVTPYVTGTGSFKRPFERYYDDPVYDVHDADDDGQIDNPGNILYYVPTRTNQTENYNVSIGLSATWSRPLDQKLQEQCKEAAQASINQMQQLTANKRLDFEIARLKNCGELMQAGIMFHPKSPYASICADVMLATPVGQVTPHTHSLNTNQPPEPIETIEVKANGTAEDLGVHSIGNVD
tara:strand:+ start:980 stop:1888 length:909 start_codon:yes stop_codon:yes gene_type:complete